MAALLLAGGHCLAQAGIGTAAREAEYDALIRSAREAGAEAALPRLDQLMALDLGAAVTSTTT